MKKFVAVILTLVLVAALPSFALAASREDRAEDLLSAIDSLGRHGWILNCPFAIEETTVDLLEDVYGAPDTNDYVEAGKGSYAEFRSADVVAGYNKGEQVFELRSFDDRLRDIRIDDVTNYFGTPDYSTTSAGDRIIGYAYNDSLKIKFVFDGDSENAAVDHYNILWPDGTANLMADDPGREW